MYHLRSIYAEAGGFNAGLKNIMRKDIPDF